MRFITSKAARYPASVALDRGTSPPLRYKRPARGKVRVITRAHTTTKAKSGKVAADHRLNVRGSRPAGPRPSKGISTPLGLVLRLSNDLWWH